MVLSILLCMNNNSVKHQLFVYAQLNYQTVLFQALQFSISHLFAHCWLSNSSVWRIDRNLSDATTPGLSGPGSNGNEDVLHITQSFYISEASPSNYLMWYTRTLIVGVLAIGRDAVDAVDAAQANRVNLIGVLGTIEHCVNKWL